MAKIFVIMGEVGNYDDWYDWTCVATTTHERAEEIMAEYKAATLLVTERVKQLTDEHQTLLETNWSTFSREEQDAHFDKVNLYYEAASVITNTHPDKHYQSPGAILEEIPSYSIRELELVDD